MTAYFNSIRSKEHTGSNLKSCPRSEAQRRESLVFSPHAEPRFQVLWRPLLSSYHWSALLQPLARHGRQLSNLKKGQRESIPLADATKTFVPVTTVVPGCVHICIYVCTCVYVCICVCVLYTYKCTHVHTSAHREDIWCPYSFETGSLNMELPWWPAIPTDPWSLPLIWP